MNTTSTDCPALDRLLDGGLESDAITLVFGEGGSGKTNLALQCARVVAAEGRRVAYIDTEGVSQKRLEQVFETLPDDGRGAAEDRLLFYTPYTISEQEKMVKSTALLRDVGLIVVDSINMHYRLHIDGPDSEREAGRSLYQQLHHLTMHARQHHIPVLITGQVYGGEDATQPFARRVMEHLVKALVRFEKRPDGTRRATVLKHRSIEEGRQTRFRIGPHGLEDLDGATRATVPSAGASGSRPDPAKRSAGPAATLSPSATPPDTSDTPDRRHAAGPADLDDRERDEARRDADAWGVDGPGAADPGFGPATEGPLGPDAETDGEPGAVEGGALHAQADEGPRADFVPEGPTDPAGHLFPTDADGPAPDDTAGAATTAEDDGPATSLLTDEERREAEALPGFSRASSVPPPEPPEKRAEDR